MLSLVTEKISNILKLWIPALAIRSQDGSTEEITRDRRIQLTSVAIGILVALMCHADFFDIMNNAGNISPWLTWEQVTFKGIGGCIITGFFLSQGSKFFHDLLDTLLYLKNTKRTLYQKGEIEKRFLESGDALTAQELLQKISATDRQDEPDNNL